MIKKKLKEKYQKLMEQKAEQEEERLKKIARNEQDWRIISDFFEDFLLSLNYYYEIQKKQFIKVDLECQAILDPRKTHEKRSYSQTGEKVLLSDGSQYKFEREDIERYCKENKIEMHYAYIDSFNRWILVKEYIDDKTKSIFVKVA